MEMNKTETKTVFFELVDSISFSSLSTFIFVVGFHSLKASLRFPIAKLWHGWLQIFIQFKLTEPNLSICQMLTFCDVAWFFCVQIASYIAICKLEIQICKVAES